MGSPADHTTDLKGPVRLTKVRVSNFKAFGDAASFPVAPLTLLYGENSVGKSTILQALLLLKQSFADRVVETTDPQAPALITSGASVDLGPFGDAVHNRDCSLEMSLGVAFSVWPSEDRFHTPESEDGDSEDTDEQREPDATDDPPQPAPLVGPLFSGEVLLGFTASDMGHGRLTTCHIWTADLGVVTTKYVLWNNRACLVTDGDSHLRIWDALAVSWEDTHQDAPRPIFALRGPLVGDLIGLRWRDVDLDLATLEVVAGAHSALPYQEPLPANDFNSLALKWARHAGEVAHAFNRLLRSITHIGPTRHAPTRSPVDFTEAPTWWAAIHHSVPMRDDVNQWFADAGIDYLIEAEEWAARTDPGQWDPPSAPVGRLVLRSRTRPTMTFAFSDVGYGLGQVLSVAAHAVSQPESGAIILVEQPELHLHPRLQTEVGDLLLLAIAARREQLIVETHSEHLLLRLGRRIRDGVLNRDDLAVLWVGDLDEAPGRRQRAIVNLAIDESGEVVDWPPGFFSEDINERLARPAPTDAR